jgi:hypothetical protein
MERETGVEPATLSLEKRAGVLAATCTKSQSFANPRHFSIRGFAFSISGSTFSQPVCCTGAASFADGSRRRGAAPRVDSNRLQALRGNYLGGSARATSRLPRATTYSASSRRVGRRGRIPQDGLAFWQAREIDLRKHQASCAGVRPESFFSASGSASSTRRPARSSANTSTMSRSSERDRSAHSLLARISYGGSTRMLPTRPFGSGP